MFDFIVTKRNGDEISFLADYVHDGADNELRFYNNVEGALGDLVGIYREGWIHFHREDATAKEKSKN